MDTIGPMGFSVSFRGIARVSMLLLLLAPNAGLGQTVPEGHGQLENVPRLIEGGTDEAGRAYAYYGQVASNQKLILTASNGFFTKGVCQAKGESTLPKVGDDHLIGPNFAYLDWKAAEGSLRWHVLLARPGKVRFAVFLETEKSGVEVDVHFAGAIQTVRTAATLAGQAQPWNLEFDAPRAGEFALRLERRASGGRKAPGKLHRIESFGPALEGANLLRVRWRPAAAHGGYDSSRLRQVQLLVFTTRSTQKVSSYSPITTPFGYYGTTFQKDGRSGTGFNFSMWGSDKAGADLKQMPHLLGVGSPEGEFSGFGHEGSGVKPRGWEPMPDRPEVVVQALRLEPGELYDRYAGYYFDHPSGAWKFFAAGNKWHGGKSKEHLKLGSFCEVPGPPQVERTGDVYREVRRRAWAYDDGEWVALDVYKPSGAGSSGEPPVNKRWFTSDEGAFAMGCGGIRLYRHESAWVKKGQRSEKLPDFLTVPSVRTLQGMPIRYGEMRITEVARDRVTLEIEVAEAGALCEGKVFFGTRDALTFAPRELHGTEKKSELSQTVNERTWQRSAVMPSPSEGSNQVTLEGLEPGTTYFYRVLVSDAESRVWNDATLSFETPE